VKWLAALLLALLAIKSMAATAYVSDELVLGVYAEENSQGQRLAHPAFRHPAGDAGSKRRVHPGAFERWNNGLGEIGLPDRQRAGRRSGQAARGRIGS